MEYNPNDCFEKCQELTKWHESLKCRISSNIQRIHSILNHYVRIINHLKASFLGFLIHFVLISMKLIYKFEFFYFKLFKLV